MGFIKSALMSECPNGFSPNVDYTRGKVLQDVISAKIERDLWGKFTLSLTLANTADNRQRAAYDAGFFTCYDRPLGNHPQIFLPTKIKTRGNVLEVTAQHVTTRLAEYTIYSPGTFTAPGTAMAHAKQNSSKPYDFSFALISASVKTGYIEILPPLSLYSFLFNQENVLKSFGGYYEIDNLNITHNDIGNIEHTFIYGRELIAEEYELDMTNYVRGFYFYRKQEGAANDYTTRYLTPRAGTDRRNYIQNIERIDLSNTEGSIETAATSWMNDHAGEYTAAPELSMKLTPILMYQTVEGQNFAAKDIHIGTKIHVIDEFSGVNADAVVTAYTYDPLKERYLSVDISNTRNKLPRILGKMAKNTGINIYR